MNVSPSPCGRGWGGGVSLGFAPLPLTPSRKGRGEQTHATEETDIG